MALRRIIGMIREVCAAYDQEKGLLRRASPDNNWARLVALSMGRQLGDSQLIRDLRFCLTSLGGLLEPEDTCRNYRNLTIAFFLIGILFTRAGQLNPQSLTARTTAALGREMLYEQHLYLVDLAPISIFQVLQQANLLTHENIRILLRYPDRIRNIKQIFETIEQEQLLTQEHRDRLLGQSAESWLRDWARDLLFQGRLNTPANLYIISQHPAEAEQIAWALELLQHKGELTAENVSDVLAHPAYALSIAVAFAELESVHLLIPENRAIILGDPVNAISIALAFSGLTLDQLLTPENQAAILQRPAIVSDVAKILSCLHHVHLLTPETRATVLQLPTRAAKHMSSAYLTLEDTRLETPENISVMLQYADWAGNIADLFFALASQALLTDKNRAAILQHHKQSAGLLAAIRALTKNPRGLQQADLDVLWAKPKEALFIAQKRGGVLDPEDRVTRDFLSIRGNVSLLLQARAAFFRPGGGHEHDIGQLPPEILFKVAAETGRGVLDPDSSMVAARGRCG